MGIGQKVIPAAQDGLLAGRSPTVHRDELPEIIFIPHLQIGGLAFVFEILRSPSDRAKGMKGVLFPKATRTLEIHMVLEHTSLAQFDSRPDYAVGPHLHRGGHLSLRMHHGRGMNRHTGFFSGQ